MYKILNILMFLIIFLFIFFIYDYYSSSKNIKSTNFNRSNIDQLLKKKIKNLPILENDTDNVIIFNDTSSEEFKNDTPRSFWDLLKVK